MESACAGGLLLLEGSCVSAAVLVAWCVTFRIYGLHCWFAGCLWSSSAIVLAFGVHCDQTKAHGIGSELCAVSSHVTCFSPIEAGHRLRLRLPCASPGPRVPCPTTLRVAEPSTRPSVLVRRLSRVSLCRLQVMVASESFTGDVACPLPRGHQGARLCLGRGLTEGNFLIYVAPVRAAPHSDGLHRPTAIASYWLLLCAVATGQHYQNPDQQ